MTLRIYLFSCLARNVADISQPDAVKQRSGNQNSGIATSSSHRIAANIEPRHVA